MALHPPLNIAGDEEDTIMSNIAASHSALTLILRSSSAAARNIAAMDDRLSCQQAYLSGIAAAVAPLHSQALANKSLHARINQAVSPSISFLRAFSRAKRLERRLKLLSSADEMGGGGAERDVLSYVDCVSRLSTAVGSVSAECEPAVQTLQEAVEYLGRTKGTNKLRLRRLRDAAAALGDVCKDEVGKMRYEGPLDEALLLLQDEYEEMLRQLRHPDVGDITGAGDGKAEQDNENRVEQGMDGPDCPTLGSAEEIEVLRRIFETLASNDCLDICIDIFVKVRYREVAKALMRLNPEYLKTYEPADIDKIEWETLDSSITLWIHHLYIAVHSVLAAEKHLSISILSSAMDGAVWPECFAQISHRITSVFFRFAEGFSLSSPDPLKLFRLLDISAAATRLHPPLTLLFQHAAPDIPARFRELQKLLIHAASRAFSALENLPDNSPPPSDASVPGSVRYVINFLKRLTGETYAPAMSHVLRTESLWKAGFLSRPEPEDSLLRESVARVIEAVCGNLEGKRGMYRDRIAAEVFAMNGYWYMYMRTRGTELARLVGEEELRGKWKAAAEEAAYSYQQEAWGGVLRVVRIEGGVERGAVARGKVEVFVREVEECLRRHRTAGYRIPDRDLREQIKESVKEMLVPAYDEFLKACSPALQGRTFLTPEALRESIGRLFEGNGGGAGSRRGSVNAGTVMAEEVESPGGGRGSRRRRASELLVNRIGGEHQGNLPD